MFHNEDMCPQLTNSPASNPLRVAASSNRAVKRTCVPQPAYFHVRLQIYSLLALFCCSPWDTITLCVLQLPRCIWIGLIR